MTLDVQHVRDAAELYVAEYGPDTAIKLLQPRLRTADGQEKNAVLEAIGHIRRNFDTGEELTGVPAAR